MENDYISIKEFASIAGVSTQAIYKRLATDLQPYLQLVANVKSLNIQALDLFDCNQGCKPVDNQTAEVANQLVTELQETINFLKGQITVKDGQIAELNERLREAQSLKKNNQVLLGVEQQNRPGLFKRLFSRK